jgi:hypothetical protein
MGVVAAAVAVSLAGCGGGDEVECDYVQCSIEDAACVERVAEAVGCHLEQDIIYPEVRFLTAEEYLAENEAGSTPLTAEEERDRADYFRMEALLGLMPEGYAPEEYGADWIRNVAALYLPDRKGIVVIADHAFDDPQNDYLVLVHEMVHAYQDAAWDLTALGEEFAPTFDRFMGLRSLIEGGATVYQNLAYLELMRIDPLAVDWGAFFREWKDERLASARESETPSLDTTRFFPYAFGGEVVIAAWLTGGAEKIHELAARPPDSVRQVMHGYDAWPDQFVNEDAVFDPQAVAILPPTYTLLGGGHEGVWALNATLQRTAGGPLWADALNDVSADYLAAWRWNDAEVVAMWRIRSARPDYLIDALTPPGAKWRAAEDPDGPRTHAVTTVGEDVLLIAVSSGDARAVLADIAGWQSVEAAYMARSAGRVGKTDVLGRRRMGCALPR